MIKLTITDEDISQLEKELDGNLTFNESRRNAIINHDDIQACPGSGKTTLVATKLILLSKKWTEKYKGICVLTHTNVAKQEIITRLQKHPSGHKMLSYPHFVGTIQEFVNRFLGLPYLRTKYDFKRFSENGETIREIYNIGGRKVYYGQGVEFKLSDLCDNLAGELRYPGRSEIINLLGKIHYTNPNFDIGFYRKSGKLFESLAKNNSKRYQLLNTLKDEINQSGIFQYLDMYAFGKILLNNNPDIRLVLQKRFPLVIIDEMQDTQKYQDDLINQVFECDSVSLQRFGDPNQAIYSGMGDEETNTSYNNDTSLTAITDSHRFGNDIAHKIRGLSYNKLETLESTRKDVQGNAPHTLFLYNDENIKLVLPAFGVLVNDYIASKPCLGKKKITEFVVKAVGGIGKNNPNPNALTIKHYWADYDKAKTSNSFRATKFIHIIKKCSEHLDGNVSSNYDLLIQGVLDLMRRANRKTKNTEGRDVCHGKVSLYKELQTNETYEEFRQLLTLWIMDGFPEEAKWKEQIKKLLKLLKISKKNMRQDDIKSTREFIAYDSFFPSDQSEKHHATNIFSCENGIDIEVATIHSIKGETHDATLILETKYKTWSDINESLAYLIDEDKERPDNTGSRNTKLFAQAEFLKKLYVAASRPRHLLCMALHEEHIKEDQITDLIAKGWNIQKTGVDTRRVE